MNRHHEGAMSIYRGPAMRINSTDLELARIREIELAKRHAHHWELWWRLERQRRRWYAPASVVTIGGVSMKLTGCAVAIMFCVHLWFAP